MGTPNRRGLIAATPRIGITSLAERHLIGLRLLGGHDVIGRFATGEFAAKFESHLHEFPEFRSPVSMVSRLQGWMEVSESLRDDERELTCKTKPFLWRHFAHGVGGRSMASTSNVKKDGVVEDDSSGLSLSGVTFVGVAGMRETFNEERVVQANCTVEYLPRYYLHCHLIQSCAEVLQNDN